MLLVLAAIILSSIFGLLPSILTGKIIDEGLIGGDFGVLLVLIALSFAVLVLSNLIGVLESYLNTWVDAAYFLTICVIKCMPICKKCPTVFLPAAGRGMSLPV